MLHRRFTRALLLAGLSAVALTGSTASEANPFVSWGHGWAPTPYRMAPPPARPARQIKPAPVTTVTTTRTQSGRTTTTTTVTTTQRPGATTTSPGVVRETSGMSVAPRVVEYGDDRSRKGKSGPAIIDDPVIPSGPLHVIVSIAEQRAWLYGNGTLVATAKVSTGTKTHPTPMGVFTVIQKNRHHVSNLYFAPMPYMQRLTWSGTALHTGVLPGYPASHGCVRLPDQFAQLLWKTTKLGARVIVTQDGAKPIEIKHPKLVMPAAPVPPEPPKQQETPSDSPMASSDEPAGGALSETTGTVVRTADASKAVAAASGSSPKLEIAAPAPIIVDRALAKTTRTASADSKEAARRAAAPVSIFISRKDKKIYVRQATVPLFDMPMTLLDAGMPVGTHVYTAMEMKDGVMRWTAVTIPSAFPRPAVTIEKIVNGKKRTRIEPAIVPEGPAPSAAQALDRVEIPQEALNRLAGLVTPGSSLIVSDNPLSHETGNYTDFIVLTR